MNAEQQKIVNTAKVRVAIKREIRKLISDNAQKIRTMASLRVLHETLIEPTDIIKMVDTEFKNIRRF